MSGKYDVLAWKYEELEAENLQNRMKLMKLSDDQADKQALKEKYDNQVTICNELENNNEDLKEEVERRLVRKIYLVRNSLRLIINYFLNYFYFRRKSHH